MENFIGTNAFLWQKLAVKVQRDTTPEELQRALQMGVTFFHIECGSYTSQESIIMFDRCNETIKNYAEQCQPFTVANGIICELSGPYPRVQFTSSGRSQVQVIEHQRITLTADVRYQNQCFDEVKYVTNFDQLKRSSVGDVLSIGTVKLMVERIVSDFVTCRVTQAGFIKPFSVISNGSKDEQAILDVSSTVEELERLADKGCTFIIVPKIDSKSLDTFLESIRCKEQIARNIQIIVQADGFPLSNQINGLDRCIDAFVSKDIVALKQLKAVGKAVLYDMDTEEMMTESIEEADVIIANVNDLTKVNEHLKHINRMQLELHQQSNRTLDPDDKPMATCLNFSAHETNASAIILPLGKGNSKLATEVSLTNPLCIVLLLKTSTEEVHRILLRKYLMPVIVPPTKTNVSQQQLIRCAIAYGRRFGYLHGGNCIVTGFTLDSDTDVLGLDMRYVPLEAHRPEP
ncbi:uncharacterized protein LOC125764327 [Anopheles funestus]|uniref:uncharacterized protein LOC125764327 n=1 Tax=Anopheles funestus TaxID=62324 RepID=UPI0020C6EBA5|nr:uncharacterized protein LOC125764327 [Anopheles funestus]